MMLWLSFLWVSTRKFYCQAAWSGTLDEATVEAKKYHR